MPLEVEQASDVRKLTAHEARLMNEATSQLVGDKARVDSLKVLIGACATAVVLAFGVFFTLDSRADSKDAGVAAAAAKELAAYAKANDGRMDRLERQLDRLGDGQDAIGRKLKVQMPGRDGGE